MRSKSASFKLALAILSTLLFIFGTDREERGGEAKVGTAGRFLGIFETFRRQIDPKVFCLIVVEAGPAAGWGRKPVEVGTSKKINFTSSFPSIVQGIGGSSFL